MEDAAGVPSQKFPRSVGVVGGGTAGYFAALALKRRFPGLEVTVVESSAVPIIGVGEATTTLMPPFLHGQLGLDAVDLFRAVRPTFKLGIRFEWGLPGDYHFNYPFGDVDPITAYAFDRDLRAQSLVSQLMDTDRAPVLRRGEEGLLSLLPRVKFAYHLNNEPFVAFLAASAKTAGIGNIDMKVDSVVAGPAGIEALRGADGRELRYDLYVDASGFRSLLLEQTLKSPFESYASTLFCDRAIVAAVPQNGVIRPYTTAETMDCGWCWRIPVSGEDHRGYVHSSSFLSEDAAVAEMAKKNPGMGEPWVVKFRSGRHRDFWVGNTVAVGNSYGFVEPLESTALHMVIIEVAYLLAGLEAMAAPDDDGSFPAFASDAVGGHWDYLRWFLGAHYKWNRRLETPFWQAAREDVNVSGMQEMFDRFQRTGPWLDSDGEHHDHGDPAFGFSGLMMMLLGQHVAGPVASPARITRAEWEARVSKHAELADQALPHAEALQLLQADPALIRSFSEGPASWCGGDADRISIPPKSRGSGGSSERGREIVAPKGGGMPRAQDELEVLLHSVR